MFEQYEAQAIAEFRSMNSHFEAVLTAAMDDLVEKERKVAHDMYNALQALSNGEGLPPGETIEKILAKARGEV